MAVYQETTKPGFRIVDFCSSPFIVIWEMTRSCALKCVHCRADAINERHPHELTTEEAFQLLDEIKRFQPESLQPAPLVVLSGGDPMRRPDALDIVEHGHRIGLRMTMTPAGTDEMNSGKVRQLKEKGLACLAVSLDGSTPRLHDAFRGVEGSFRWTMDIIRWAHEADLPLQINTTVTRHNLDDLDNFSGFLRSLNIILWSVFFLVPTGRGKLEDEVGAVDYERVFHKMYELSLRAPFDIKSTEAPHYRRVIMQRRAQEERGSTQLEKSCESAATGRSAKSGTIARAGFGVNAGNGFVFISHTGEVLPSGFLPISAGNVKREPLVEIYRNSDLFTSLRDYANLKGKCGVCEFRAMCAGSRSRAYAVTGDYMESDPFCVYVPKGHPITEDEKRFWY